MSLINDMLKDLDRRNRPAIAHAAALQGLGLTARHGRGARAGRTLALGGSALFAAVVLAGITLSNTTHLQQVLMSGTTPATMAGTQETLRHVVAGSAAPATQAAATADTAPRPVNPPVTRAHEPVSQSQAQPAPAASPAPPASVVADEEIGHFEVTPRPLSPAQLLARDFQAAAAAMNNGDPVEAERLLEDLLARDNGMHKARLLLAGLYVQQQRNSRAESVLASGLLHYPQHAPYARLYAQLLAAQARDSEAINALQTALPGAGEDADYHALLAGLYQRGGKPGNAAASYRKALQLAPAHGEWWMGLGISSEQAGDAETAVSAYRQALHHPLGPALEQYVQQRLEQLTH